MGAEIARHDIAPAAAPLAVPMRPEELFRSLFFRGTSATT